MDSKNLNFKFDKMQGLKSDELGFLVGKPVDLTDIHDELSNINGELAQIKAILSRDDAIDITPRSINKLVNGFAGSIATKNSKASAKQSETTHTPVPRDIASSQSSNRSFQRLNQVVGDQVAKGSIKAGKQHIATTKARDSNGRFTSQNNTNGAVNSPKGRGKDGRFIAKNTPNDAIRDSNGRFLPKNGEDNSRAEKDSLGTKLKNIGGRISDTLGDLGSGNEQADPSIQAMGEIKGVLTPVGRGFGKLFGSGSSNGLSRGQDRWYRRFFKQNTEKARTDDLADKREQKLLSNIEKKEGPDIASRSGLLATLFLAFMGALATLLIKGFQSLATPLKFLGSFFGPLVKVLQALAHAIGLKKLADLLGGPSSPRNRNRGPGGSTRGGGARGPDDSTRGDGARGRAKALFKKLPIIGALLSAGFLAKDLNDIAENGESQETKTRQVGSAVGATAGGIGGALGGAAAGAAIGSVVPLVGTLAGGIVGALVGGIGGGKVGGMLGDKFGEWVNELREAGVTDKMAYSWDVGINAMSIMWRDFTTLAGSVWNGMVAGVQTGWANVTAFTQNMWQGVGNAFDTTTEFLKTSWAVATTLVGGALGTVWTSLGELASSVNEAIKAKTGIDIAKNVDDLKSTVKGWGESLKTAFGDFSENVKSKLNEVFGGSYLGGVLSEAQQMADTQPASTTKEQDANQTGVLNAFMKAGFTKSQAVALTAEVGRENDYNSKNLYGYHKDESNGKVNMGMISWQGDRAKRLEAYMQGKGLIKNGKMVQGQASLDAQAEFVKQEINGGGYNATKKLFAENPNADPETYAKTLGTNYIRWRYGKNALANGKSFDWQVHDKKRRAYKVKAQAKSGTATAVPFRPGYNAQTAKAAVDAATKGKATTPTDTVTPEAAPVEPQVDPNSIEGLMQTFNNFDGMANVKQAVISMLKTSAEGTTVAHQKAARGAVVPAMRFNPPAPIAEAPKVSMPLASNSAKDSNSKLDDVSRDVSDRRIAHIVTGAYSSST